MDSPIPVWILLTISLPFFSSQATKTVPSKLVQEVCHKTKGYKFCVEALDSDPRTALTSDLHGLAVITLELASSNATKTSTYIGDKLKSKNTKSSKIAALKYCLTCYNAAAGLFAGALSEVKGDEEYLMANYNAAIVDDIADQCERKMASDGGRDPLISTRNKFIKHFSNIGVVVLNLLQQQTPLAPSQSV